MTIAFVYSRGNPGLTFGIWLVAPDGSNLRSVVNPGLGPAWSHDGRWIYYSTLGQQSPADVALKKLPAAGGESITDPPSACETSSALTGPRSTTSSNDRSSMVRRSSRFARPRENGPFRVIARLSSARVPLWQIVNPTLSPDGKWLAQALTDGLTTNIWALSTSTGEWRQVTDFGKRATFIARRVSWSADGRSVLAAVGDADVVRMEGLLDPRP